LDLAASIVRAPLDLQRSASSDIVSVSTKFPRTDAFGQEIEQAAARISEQAGSALLVRYDSRAGIRESKLFQRGTLVRTFGPADERWAPTDEHAQPIRNGPTFGLDELDPDEEYATVRDALDQGFEAFGAGSRELLDEFISA
jgi:hypothetical protein